MASDSSGSGASARSLALLWGTPQVSAGRRGPNTGLDLSRIVSAAVALADAEGLSAVSMRRVAAEVGVPTMTLYGHVPGKAELVALMFDAVVGEIYRDDEPATSGNWRTRVEAVARANRDFLERHPWASHVAPTRTAMGPGAMRKYEFELRAVDGMGLSEVQMDLLVDLVTGFVRGVVDCGSRPGGLPPAPSAQQPIDPEAFPTAARVAAGSGPPQDAAPDRAFEFGLERLLDGIGVLMLNPSR